MTQQVILPNRTLIRSEATPEAAPSGVTVKYRSLLHHFDEQIIEDLILHKDYAQLWSSIAYLEGSRYLLTGYGSFGGTTLVQCAIERARESLKKKGGNEGVLLVFYFELKNEKANGFEIRASRLSIDQMNVQIMSGNESGAQILLSPTDNPNMSAIPQNQLLEFSFPRPLGETFFGKLGQTGSLSKHSDISAYDFSKLITDLHEISNCRSDDNYLRRMILRLAESDTFPSKVVVIIDKVKNMETMEMLSNFELFKNKRISFICVARREDVDQWQDADSRIAALGFREQYQHCFWEEDLGKFLFNVDSDIKQAPNFAMFQRHLRFISKGSLGNVITELRRARNIFHSSDGSTVDTSYLDDEISHDAWMQDMLDLNWSILLGDFFKGKYEGMRKDRARIGIYYLLDWISINNPFSIDILLTTANQMPVTISNDDMVIQETIYRLIYVLRQHKYTEMRKNRYHVIWDKQKYDVPHVVKRMRRNIRNPKPKLPSTPKIEEGKEEKKTEHSQTIQLEQGNSLSSDINTSNAADSGISISNEELQNMVKLLKVHRGRLQRLEEQAATFGITTPPHIVMEIDSLRSEIERLGTTIKSFLPQSGST